MRRVSFVLFFTMFFSFNSVMISQNFQKSELSFPGFTGGKILWGDYNNDGFLDLLFAGGPYPWSQLTKIYKNNGDGSFQLYNNSFLIPLSNGAGAWVDINNDGFLDLIITGYYQLLSRPVTKVYLNNQGESFTEISNNLIGVYYGTIATADFDNNGTIDILLSGLDRDFNTVTKLYKNLGNTQFEEVQTNFTGLWKSIAAWGDLNGNGKLDLIISGNNNVDNNIGIPVLKVYQNEGDGIFTEVQTSLTGVMDGSVALGDFNNDGLLDVFVTGDREFNLFGFDAAFSALYQNNGNFNFIKTENEFQKMINSNVAFGDINNDGFLDIVLSGSANAVGIEPFSTIYINDGNGEFVQSEDSLNQFSASVISLGDFNNNSKLDMMLSGYDLENQTYYTFLYENITPNTNTKPSVPTELSEEIFNDKVILNWNASTDNETETNALTYNIRLGKTSGNSEIYSPMSLHSNGFRLIPHFGNTNHNISWEVKDLVPGEYFWSVQAIDNGLLASDFSPEKRFVISSPTSVENENTTPNEFILNNNYPNPFNPSTVISFQIAAISNVKLKVYDLLGNEITTLINENMEAGSYSVNFSGEGLTSGIYLYKLTSVSSEKVFVETKKMVLMK